MAFRSAGQLVLGVALLALAPGCDSLPKALDELLDWKGTAPAASYLPPAPSVKGPPLANGEVLTEPPFVGPSGEDRAGYPRKHADQVALVRLLRMHRFDELERFVEYYQTAFEADYRKESWPQEALEAFDTKDPAIGPVLDEWVKRSPSCFVPWAARATYRNTLAWHYRGGNDASKISEAQAQKTRELHALAKVDLAKALRLRPQLLAARITLLGIESANGASGDRLKQVLSEGSKHCRLCLGLRARYLNALKPRWGGSYAKMESFVKALDPLTKQNPKLRVLGGFADADRCKVHRHDEHFSEAHEACARALQFGDDWRLLLETIDLLNEEERLKAMLPFLDRALRVAPHQRRARRLRYHARWMTGDYLGAAQDLIVARQLQPTNAWVENRISQTVKRLKGDGESLQKAGQRDEATRHFELALELAPNDRELRTMAGVDDEKEAETLLTQVDPEKDGFEAHLRVDKDLARLGRFDSVVTMWNAYIEMHPKEGRAYYERGGAKYLARQLEAAIEDMDRGCRLGHSTSCRDAQLMRTRR